MKIKTEKPYLTVGDLKKILSDLPDDLEILYRKVGGIGNIAEISSVMKTTYGFMGTDVDCLLLDASGQPAVRKNQETDEELYNYEDEE